MAQGMDQMFSSVPDPFSGISMNRKEKLKNAPFRHMDQGDSEWKETWKAFLSEHGAEGIYMWIEENNSATGVHRDVVFRSMQKAFGFTTPQAIYKWQNGRTLPSIDNLVGLSVLLGVTIDEILVIEE